MASLISDVISQIYTIVSADSESGFDWAFNGTEIEGRSDDTFFIISPNKIDFSGETYQGAAVRYRKCQTSIKCTAYSGLDTTPIALEQCFENEICTRLFESALAVSKITCSEITINRDYERLEMNAQIFVDILYVY